LPCVTSLPSTISANASRNPSRTRIASIDERTAEDVMASVAPRDRSAAISSTTPGIGFSSARAQISSKNRCRSANSSSLDSRHPKCARISRTSSMIRRPELFRKLSGISA
jgi:hypothetical protein